MTRHLTAIALMIGVLTPGSVAVAAITLGTGDSASSSVDRPAEQYRGRYQLRLGEAQGLLT